MTAIRFSNISKSYGHNAPVLSDVNLEIAPGEFCVFVGPSGCGKSTLLRMIAGLEEVSAGDLFIDEQRVNEVSPSARGIAMVFQSYALFPHLTVFDNLSFGLHLLKRPKDEVSQKVAAVAKILQLEPYLLRKPKELSGGQRQRVAIGRAIIREPKAFLFDEPLSNLDTALRVQTRIEIAKLHRSFASASMVYVTHDQVEAMTLADKIVLLHTGEAILKKGSIAQVGSPMTLFHRPRNLFTAGFIGSPKMNFLPATLACPGDQISALRLQDGTKLLAEVDSQKYAIGAPVTLGIRAEHMRPQEGETQLLKGKVDLVERLGTSSYLYSHLFSEHPAMTGISLVSQGQNQPEEKAGDLIFMAMPADALHVFDAAGDALFRTASLPI